MGSLNGDIMVMRNGRSTSQVSVYNYPEHLNPFYEDDQHKRLRFWKISKNDNEGRRNSFSFGNLRDMWTFKSFRSKKKSSTLGITKTSESPPPLRRDFGAANNGWNTFDNRMRHSTTGMNGDNFQRNATYRSSLQTLPTNVDRMGFNRNDDYRSTIQVPRPNPRYRPQSQTPQPAGLRYVYGGSVTPQPLRNSNIIIPYDPHNNSDNVFRGSSMTSTGSTNPFDSDGDEDIADANSIQRIHSGSTSTLSKNTPSKKRRAPAPPTPIHGRTPTIRIESSQNNAQNDDLCIREDTDIAHLTAEIQSFVKDKNNDDLETESRVENRVPAGAENIASTTTTTVVNQNEAPPVANPAIDDKSNINTNVEIKSPLPPKEMRKSGITAKVQSPTPPKREATTEISSKVYSSATIERDNNRDTKAATTTETVLKVDSPTPIKRDTKNINRTANTTRDTPKEHIKSEPTAKIDLTAALTTAATEAPKKDANKVMHLEEIIKTSSVSSPREVSQTNGFVKAEIKTVKTSKFKSVDKAKPITSDSDKFTETEITNELKSNGAIPKKLTYSTQVAASDLCIKENDELQPERPTPMKRVSKTNTEEGQVECIHIHVGSPRATPRDEQGNTLSSFKQDHHDHTVDVITTKTPFILTSPPVHRKSVQEKKQTVEIGNPYVVPKLNTSKQLSIQEEQVAIKPEVKPKPPLSPKPVEGEQVIDKPEVKPKPPLSPKPVVGRNGKVHSFAEIHKPLRSKVNQRANGHVRRIEELPPSPPNVPKQQRLEEEQENPLKVKETVEVFETKTNERVADNFIISAATSAPATYPVTTTVKDDVATATVDTEFQPLYRPKPQTHMEWKQSSLAPLEEHIPPEKRKSVKDIIESINRSQRLLHAAANKDFTIITAGPPESPDVSPTTHDESLRMLDENQREIKRIIREIDEVTTSPPSYNECVGAQKMDNNEIFQKCKVNKEVYDYRETSPITSNLDWNPVPKPKRTKSPNE